MSKKMLAAAATAALTVGGLAFAGAPAAHAASGCAAQTVGYGSRGGCAMAAQEWLKDQGFLTGRSDGKFGVGSVNAALNYQRSRGLAETGTFDKATWSAMLNGRRPLAAPRPAACRAKGVVLCANKAKRTLTLLKDGVAKKTLKVRFGGFTSTDNGSYRIFQTAKGSFRVYGKDPKAYSGRWKASMPYSVKFDPTMYVHYSADFAKKGYAAASHGCINVRSKADAAWIYRNTPVGAKVVVF